VPTTSRAGGPPRRSQRPRRPVDRGPATIRPAAAPRRPVYEVVAAPPEGTTFADLGVAAPIIKSLEGAGMPTPFPIQAATLGSSLAGRDVLGRGRTGSGKTVAFAIPTVMAVAASTQRQRPGSPRALVLVPTRELAAQVAGVINPLARAMGLRIATVHGGVGQGPQVSALRRGIDIMIACPGRLEDLIEQRECTLAAVKVCVLDEADHLADLGFLPAVRRLLDLTPAGGQRLLFSATLDGAVDALVRQYLTNPVEHSVDAVDSTPPELDHHAFNVAPGDKAAVVRELASGKERTLLFTRTKYAAKKLAGDLAARGIHVDDIALVVHVDPPTEHKAYLHRSGRTARAGARGAVVTVILPDQAREVATMIRQAGIRPASIRVAPGAPQTVALTGPPASPVYRTAPPATTPVRPSSRPNGSARRSYGSQSRRRAG
jgi:superfamily II DNA/RNA helicase